MNKSSNSNGRVCLISVNGIINQYSMLLKGEICMFVNNI